MYLGTFAICYTDIFRKSTKMIDVSKSLSTQIEQNSGAKFRGHNTKIFKTNFRRKNIRNSVNMSEQASWE